MRLSVSFIKMYFVHSERLEQALACAKFETPANICSVNENELL